MEFLRQIVVIFGLAFVVAAVGSNAQNGEGENGERSIDGFEVEIGESLLSVMDYLQKAHNASTDVEQCRLSIESAIDSALWVQTLLLNNSYYPTIKDWTQSEIHYSTAQSFTCQNMYSFLPFPTSIQSLAIIFLSNLALYGRFIFQRKSWIPHTKLLNMLIRPTL